MVTLLTEFHGGWGLPKEEEVGCVLKGESGFNVGEYPREGTETHSEESKMSLHY